MIGCIGYTDIIECSQYVQDVHLIKTLYLVALLSAAILIIYYSKTKSYKRLTTKYQSYKTMLMLPVGISYLAIFVILLGLPGLMSVNTSLDEFSPFVWAILTPAIFWAVLMIFYFIGDWVFLKLGFSGGKAFLKAVLKK